jgi:citrate synthase
MSARRAGIRRAPPDAGSGFGGWNVAPNDPRAEALLAASDLSAELHAVRTEGERIAERKADFGLALALVARSLDRGPTGAGDLLMMSRLIGLIAHALDQAIDGSPIRARLRYVGPEPGAH